MEMPALFVGHGSPMNAIEDNAYTREWDRLGRRIKPEAVLMISAHWFSHGTFTQDEKHPKVINDMYGFPEELYNVNYQVEGSKKLTESVFAAVSVPMETRNDWGIDHGAWSVLVHMYPERNIPVVQLSVDADASPEEKLNIGRELRLLREEGIFIIGSGNIVHNLRMVSADPFDGFDWANQFDADIRKNVLNRDELALINYHNLGESAQLAVPTTDHFDPLLYVVGASTATDTVTVFNNERIYGSLSMTSYLFE